MTTTLANLADTHRAAERTLKIAVFDAITTGAATKSQVSRHTGIYRSTIDRWLKDVAGITAAKVDAAIAATADLDVAPWPSQSEIDAGRVPESVLRVMQRSEVDDVWLLVHDGSKAEPGEKVGGGRRYVGSFSPADARVVTDMLAARLRGEVSGEAAYWQVSAWADDLLAVESIPF